MKNVRFVSVAEEEMNLAAAYYEEQARNLGVEYLKEVKRVVEGITENPELAPKIEGEIRRRILRRFPFGILYRIHFKEIIILAVMHLSRDPDYWKNR